MLRRLRDSGITARLILATLAVMTISVLTAWAVASRVGPRLFHLHLTQANHTAESMEYHAEEAFATSNAITFAVAIGAALLTSLVVILIGTRKLGASVCGMAAAAADLAGGRFGERVVPPRVGSEFDALATAFNTLGERLEQGEALRRQLMSDVAHELRTPVTTIVAYVDALEEGVETLSPATIEVLRAQSARLVRLASDLAEVTRVESGSLRLALEPVQPLDLVRDVSDAARPRCTARGITLSTRVADGLPAVTVDRDRWGQVLGNLVDNAISHTPAGGRIDVVAQRAGLSVRFVVADDGEGIDPAHVPFVFERFYRVDAARDRARGGTGIGLAIVHALVEAHGGTVTAHSDGVGKGATFTIDLPASSSLTGPHPVPHAAHRADEPLLGRGIPELLPHVRHVDVDEVVVTEPLRPPDGVDERTP